MRIHMGTGSKRGYTDIDLVVAKQFSECFFEIRSAERKCKINFPVMSDILPR